jgi:hypothetical protein
MKDSKNKRTTILVIILLGFLVIAYKMIFMPATDVNIDTLAANASSSVDVENISQEMNGINFDTSIMQNPSFQSLRSIAAPLVPLPVGRQNPFASVGSN